METTVSGRTEFKHAASAATSTTAPRTNTSTHSTAIPIRSWETGGLKTSWFLNKKKIVKSSSEIVWRQNQLSTSVYNPWKPKMEDFTSLFVEEDSDIDWHDFIIKWILLKNKININIDFIVINLGTQKQTRRQRCINGKRWGIKKRGLGRTLDFRLINKVDHKDLCKPEQAENFTKNAIYLQMADYLDKTCSPTTIPCVQSTDSSFFESLTKKRRDAIFTSYASFLSHRSFLRPYKWPLSRTPNSQHTQQLQDR